MNRSGTTSETTLTADGEPTDMQAVPVSAREYLTQALQNPDGLFPRPADVSAPYAALVRAVTEELLAPLTEGSTDRAP
jgi:hypothetical protein